MGGFASWMRLQSEEEMGHAMRLFDYILNRDGRVELQSIGKPQAKFQIFKRDVSDSAGP